MRHAFTLWSALALALATQGACRRAPAPAPAALSSSSASPSNAAASSTPPNRDFPPDEQALAAASASVQAFGPSPQGAAGSERVERLRGLLRGQLPAANLPLVETDQGVEFSPGLYASLTTESTATGLANVGNGSVTLSPPVVVSGKLDEYELTRHSAHMSGSFRRCYQRALEDQPKLAGKVTLLFAVDREGKVSSIAVESAPPRSTWLQDCLKGRGRGQLFPGSAEGAEAKFRLQIAFKVQAPEANVRRGEEGL